MQRFKHAAMSLNNLQTICKALYSCCYHKTNAGQKKAQATHRRPRATETVTNVSFIFETWRQISVQVTGKRRNKGIGLEIPATYPFCLKKESKILKLKELLNDKEDKEAS